MSAKRIGEPIKTFASKEIVNGKGAGFGWKISEETKKKIEAIEKARNVM